MSIRNRRSVLNTAVLGWQRRDTLHAFPTKSSPRKLWMQRGFSLGMPHRVRAMAHVVSFGPGCAQSDAVAIGAPCELLAATQMQHSRLEGPLSLALGRRQAGLVEHDQKVCQSPNTRAPQAGAVIVLLRASSTQMWATQMMRIRVYAALNFVDMVGSLVPRCARCACLRQCRGPARAGPCAMR
eukprot:14960307-Alexandrium_andersonii.AAC.1